MELSANQKRALSKRAEDARLVGNTPEARVVIARNLHAGYLPSILSTYDHYIGSSVQVRSVSGRRWCEAWFIAMSSLRYDALVKDASEESKRWEDPEDFRLAIVEAAGDPKKRILYIGEYLMAVPFLTRQEHIAYAASIQIAKEMLHGQEQGKAVHR